MQDKENGGKLSGLNCPGCKSKLSVITAYGLSVDVCTDSCGGIWLDAGELDRVDRLAESVDSRVLRPMSNQRVPLDRSKPRHCPRCSSTVLECQLEDKTSDLEIDICPSCEGVFLDFGELETLRKLNTAEDNRSEVIDGYLRRYSKNPESASKGLRAVCELLFR